MDSPRTGLTSSALLEAALKTRIKKLQKQIDEAVKKIIDGDNRLHAGQTPAALVTKAVVAPKPPKGKYTLAASLVKAVLAADQVMMDKLATSKRSEVAALIGPATLRVANSAQGVRLTPKDLSTDWLTRPMRMPQRKKAHDTLPDSWKEIAKINGRGNDILKTPAKFLDFVIAQRQSTRPLARSVDTTSTVPNGARRAEAEIWFTDKRTIWFRDSAGHAVRSTVSWQKRLSSSQFRMPGAPKKTSLSKFGKSRGYSLDELIRLSNEAQAAFDAKMAREREAKELEAEMQDFDLFQPDALPSPEEQAYAA